jgi:pyridoxal phosphate enzyme (YggS family)
MSVAENIERIHEQIQSAAKRTGRAASEVTLMAVSKTFPSDSIREAYAAGIRVFGENRVQEFAGKVDALRDLADANWHMIGHLQTNKASKAAELFHAVDSVDSLRLARKLNEATALFGKKLLVLIELNVGGEAAKTGAHPQSPEFEEILASAQQFEYLAIRGLMTVPPFTDDPQQARPFFRKLRELRDQVAKRNLPAVSMDVLSMGMSHDFEVAIEEGSTCVRVGTGIFGKRQKA